MLLFQVCIFADGIASSFMFVAAHVVLLDM